MKRLILLLGIFCFIVNLNAQDDKPKWPAVDKSTLDCAYYPSSVAFRNYLSEAERNMQPKIKLLYSRPMKNNRDIFGSLIPYGEEWRLGANEATTITFYNAVGIGGSTIPRGTYSMTALVNQNDWVINFSKELSIWGNANRDQEQTVASVRVMTKEAKNSFDALSMTFQEIDDHTCNLVIQWDKTRVSLPISLNPVVFNNTDPSPMDMSHYPDNSRFLNYVDADKKAAAASKIIVTYARPSKKGRNIFGDLLKIGEVWRIGANEATELVFQNDVKINNTTVSKGRYSMFAKLTSENNWDIIFSKDIPVWGAANRDESKDAATVSIPVTKETEVVEHLSIIFEEKSSDQVDLVIAWDTVRATMPITILP